MAFGNLACFLGHVLVWLIVFFCNSYCWEGMRFRHQVYERTSAIKDTDCVKLWFVAATINSRGVAIKVYNFFWRDFICHCADLRILLCMQRLYLQRVLQHNSAPQISLSMRTGSSAVITLSRNVAVVVAFVFTKTEAAYLVPPISHWTLLWALVRLSLCLRRVW